MRVLLVEDDAHQESILLGKGIGYGQKPGNVIAQRQENLPRHHVVAELVDVLHGIGQRCGFVLG